MALKVPKSIDFYKNNLLLGLRNGSIMEIKNVMDEKSDTKIHMHSHFEGETWGLAVLEKKIHNLGRRQPNPDVRRRHPRGNPLR